jgi:hypothetical protein
MFDAEFVVAAGFVIFVGLMVYFGVHRNINSALDAHAARISAELAEAARLRVHRRGLVHPQWNNHLTTLAAALRAESLARML